LRGASSALVGSSPQGIAADGPTLWVAARPFAAASHRGGTLTVVNDLGAGPPHHSSRGRSPGWRANSLNGGRTPRRAGRHPQQPPAPGRLRHAPSRQPVRTTAPRQPSRVSLNGCRTALALGHLAYRSTYPPVPSRRTAGRYPDMVIKAPPDRDE